jgi:hypothetical protein
LPSRELAATWSAPTAAAPLVLDLVLFMLKNTLRWLMGEEQITHPGMEYYQA